MKKAITCYLCWIFGVHYIYLGKIGLWVLYVFSFGGLGLWCFIDIFRIPSMVEEYNLLHGMSQSGGSQNNISKVETSKPEIKNKAKSWGDYTPKEKKRIIISATLLGLIFFIIFIAVAGEGPGASVENDKYVSRLKFSKCKCYLKHDYLYGVKISINPEIRCSATLYNPTEYRFEGTGSEEKITN